MPTSAAAAIKLVRPPNLDSKLIESFRYICIQAINSGANSYVRIDTTFKESKLFFWAE